MWQKARSLIDGSEFWVVVERPERHCYRMISADGTHYEEDSAKDALWYRTNVRNPVVDKDFHYTLTPADDVELLSEFADTVADDLCLMRQP